MVWTTSLLSSSMVLTDLPFCRLINGVRRWISANSMSNLHHSHRVSTLKAAAYGKPSLNEPDQLFTGKIALQLLDPTVSEEEEAEYQRCVSSFLIPLTSMTSSID